MATNGTYTNGNTKQPKIILYTNHGCPYAQRAHITLKELGLPYDEVIIDLDTPRPDWYLKVNPRGLVPSIKYSDDTLNEEIITESAVVAQFLADSKPSHLLPTSTSSPKGPLFRARLNFLMDTWNSKVTPFMFSILREDDQQQKEEKTKEWVGVIEKEIEPLLKDANPFFMGSKDLTLAEVHVAPFLLRFYALSNQGKHMPKSLVESSRKLPHFGKWADAIMAKESVTEIWDEETVLSKMEHVIAKFKAKAK